ncbi:MAG: DEAD/DEAH box helicase family protein [Miltoncostaeaceae bacterium]
MNLAAPDDGLAALSFAGSWRPYQELALAAMERDLAASRHRTHIVAPPGSGKTLLGVEIVRRLGAPAVVLTPNSAVQAQWPAAAAMFGAGPAQVGTEPGSPIAVLTYQSLCRLDEPELVLGDLATRRWTAERAEVTGETPEAVATAAALWTGEAARRRSRELARIANGIKREIARAEHGDLHLGDLLQAGARGRLDALRQAGVRTVVLDECHHLASMWGYIVRLIVEELGPGTHLVGLTATPPGELTADEAELYESLLGPVDFTVPTPAVVIDGHLAPYQELAWLTEPLDSESRWLDDHDQRFRDLVATLHEDMEGPLSFPGWVIGRMRERPVASSAEPDEDHAGGGPGGGEQDNDAALSWAAFARRRPRLARAGARFLISAGLTPPAGAPTGEGYREEPGLEDWLALLQDYVLRCLRTHPSPEAAARDAAIAAALRDLGYTLTRQGIRRGAGDVDRLLVSSAAKALALVEVLSVEHAARGHGIRALVLCDAERRAQRPDDALTGVLPAAAGTAAEAVQALGSDARTGHLVPTLVSGRGVRCMPADAQMLMSALAARAPGLEGWHVEPDPTGLARIEATGPEWTPQTWVRLATEALQDGDIMAMVGTRALLGEGWNAPCVNCLVDLTAATTRVSTTQMRGRSLRLDPADPAKLANNWDVVCIAPGHARGEADYERFVRKHEHLYAPADDGAIEAGPSHVHPALGPFAPPAHDEFAEINHQMARRAADHGRARALWRLGGGYAASETSTLVVRPRTGGSPARRTAGTAQPIPAGRLGAALAIGRARDELNSLMPIERAALAVRDALATLGELSPEVAGGLEIEPRASGYLRVSLPGASEQESALFTAALDQLLRPPATSRYVVSRLVPGRHGVLGAALRALAGRTPYPMRWSGVPDDLAGRRERADAFHAAWARWFGPGQVLFTGRDGPGRLALAEAAAEAIDAETAVRRIWR